MNKATNRAGIRRPDSALFSFVNNRKPNHAMALRYCCIIRGTWHQAQISLTLRNWLIGSYIAEYEQKETDRAEYGARLLENLSSRLVETGMGGAAPRSLRQYRQFYLVYPGIWQTPSAKSFHSLTSSSIRQTLPAKSQTASTHLEEQLLDKLQEFLLELGHGRVAKSVTNFVQLRQWPCDQVKAKEKKNCKT